MSNKSNNYYKTRFKYDPKRLNVWRAISKYLQPYIGSEMTVLDLGSGYGDFINLINAKQKYALDISSDLKDYINKNVTFINKPSTELEDLPSHSIDVIFSSNMLEHLDRNEFDQTIKGAQKTLKPGGILILIQPNYRYAYKNYFDDYTHKTIFTHMSLIDALDQYGFKPIKVVPKFLPLSIKSRFPKYYFLIRTYLRSPIKPFGKQMLLIFKAKDKDN